MPDLISAYDLQQRDGLTRQEILQRAEAKPESAFLFNSRNGAWEPFGPSDKRDYCEDGFKYIKRTVISDWINLDDYYEKCPKDIWNETIIYSKFPDYISGEIAYKLLGKSCPHEIRKNYDRMYSMPDIVDMMENQHMINLFEIPEPWRINRETIWSYLSKIPSIAVLYKSSINLTPCPGGVEI